MELSIGATTQVAAQAGLNRAPDKDEDEGLGTSCLWYISYRLIFALPEYIN
jgi:hypothetical protein